MPTEHGVAGESAQYGPGRIALVWLLATLPMPVMAFLVGPALFPGASWQSGLGIWVLLIGGMVWQFVLSLILLAAEGQVWRWPALRERLWLGRPVHPTTGRRDLRLLAWLLLTVPAYALVELGPPAEWLGALTVAALPWLETLPRLDLRGLMVPELVGAWWVMGIALLSCLFNYALGEELLFRGVLLPRMRGVFGRWDWVANAVLFGLYHLHRPTAVIPIMRGGLAWTLPARRFRSIWFAIIPHAIEGLFVLAAVFAVVSGLAFR